MTTEQELMMSIIASKQHVRTKPHQYQKALRKILDWNPDVDLDMLCARICWESDRLLTVAFQPDLEYM